MRKILKYSSLLLSVAMFAACDDDFNMDVPESVNTTVTISGDYQTDPATGAYIIPLGSDVKFLFTGDKVDNILFYSGDIGEEYRYRLREIADDVTNLRPSITIKTAANAGTAKSRYTFMTTNVIEQFDEQSVINADWHLSPTPIKTDMSKVTTATAQFYNAGTGSLGADGARDVVADDYSEWYSHEKVAYGVIAKCDRGEDLRLYIQDFQVKNIETRDYSYTYNGVEVSVKRSKDYQIMKACSAFASNFTVTNDMTGACWAQYTPLETMTEEGGAVVPNSQRYVWNVAELGLIYGEGSGFPWVTTNKYGQAIKCVYANNYTTSVGIGLPADKGKDMDPALIPEELKSQPYESWLISRNHYTRQVTHDLPTSVIKTKVMTMPANYTFPFVSEGLYTVTFYFNNQNANNTNQSVQQMKLMIVK